MAKPTAHQLIKDIENQLTNVKSEVKDLDYRIQSLQTKAEQLEHSLDKVESQLIPPSEYNIVKQLIFGAVGLILVAVVGALITLVVKQ